MPLEKTVVYNFRKGLAIAGGRTIKTHGGLLMSLEPDIIGCYQGYLFAAEAKRDETMKPTRGQEYCLQEWSNAGAIAFVFWNWKNAIEYIQDEVNRKISGSPKSKRVYEGVIPY